MTTKERLDRLTERHEALTQSVEMLHTDVKALMVSSKELLESVEGLEAFGRETYQAVGQLFAVARSHEERISKLEG